jgi:hypothetical protein
LASSPVARTHLIAISYFPFSICHFPFFIEEVL